MKWLMGIPEIQKMRGNAHAFVGSFRELLTVIHEIRQRRIRKLSNSSMRCDSSSLRQCTMQSKRRRIILAFVSLTLISIARLKTPPQMKSIYRILSNCYSESTSYMSLRNVDGKKFDNLDLPPVKARRDPPSHITLCKELISRRQMTDNGQSIDTSYSLTEDESVCTDWVAPHASLLEIMASTVVGRAAEKYKVTYRHNCGDEKYKQSSVINGNDWTTIQQIFPVSSLVLDVGSIDEDEILSLCIGCISARNNVGSFPDGISNPSWYNPEETHHCIIDPRTSLKTEETLSDTRDRSEARTLVVGRILPSLQDRFLLAAAEQKLESPEDEGPSFASSSENGMNLRPDSSNNEDAVIYMEKGSLGMELLQYAKHIPSSVTSISIHLHPLCALSDECLKHGHDLQAFLDEAHDSATVNVDIVTSTAEAYSKMVMANYLICAPGTTGCLIPAVSKGDDTVAVIGESPDRPNTFQYFDFVTGFDQLHVATVEARSISRFGDANIVSDSFNINRSKQDSDVSIDFSLEPQPSIFPDGCLEMRGSIGSWEQDFAYSSLKTDKAKELRGSSRDGVIVSERFIPSKNVFHDIGLKKTDDGQTRTLQGNTGLHDVKVKKTDSGQLRAQRADKNPVWKDSNPECQLRYLNLVGFCEIMSLMKLTVIHFVGDSYTQDMVISFWKLLGLPDPENPGKVQTGGQTPATFRRTVTCEKEKYEFDIVFTPNEKLVTDDKPSVKVTPPDTNNGVYQGITPDPKNLPYHGTVIEGNIAQYPGTIIQTPNLSTGWRSNPYDQQVFYSGATTGSTPGYSNNCGCVPFMEQYKSNIAYTEPLPLPQQTSDPKPYIPAPRAKQFITVPRSQNPNQTFQQTFSNPYQTFQQPFPKQNRQIIVAGLGPNQSYDEYCKQLDAFGQRVNDSVNPNDIVFMRSAVTPHGSCSCQTCGRRTEETDNEHIMTAEEIQKANDYMSQSIHEYRRRTKQTDLLTYSPLISQKPQIHFLDVSHMTSSHPHAKESSPGNDHGRKLCQAQGYETAPMVDSWNHALYSNMRDVAMAQLAAQSRPQVQTRAAPPGSPYSYPIPLYQQNYFP